MTEPGWPFGGRPKPRRVWSLWKTGQLMDAEVAAHPSRPFVPVFWRV